MGEPFLKLKKNDNATRFSGSSPGAEGRSDWSPHDGRGQSPGVALANRKEMRPPRHTRLNGILVPARDAFA